ncbi:MAG: TetR/AcrR family transcriptional regulator [Desulfobacterales bacterium]|jgi:AcrR family transcriptional regulator|nr:TetR/AcrR family transcriptional regulator [Desulfobacterales bacterium]
MPRAKRSSTEVDSIKDQILREALDLMNKHGFEGFSMRKLGERLGVSAKTIYNYYSNKDELYLVILTNGFQQLYDRFDFAYKKHSVPFDRLEKMGQEYMNFGIEHAHLYNLMFTWHVPKFKDYIGTSLEPVAQVELETALNVSALFIKAIKEAVPEGYPITDDEARFHMIWMWSQMHGFIAGFNNTLLDYMHENPSTLKERIFRHTFNQFKHEIMKRQKAGNAYPTQ